MTNEPLARFDRAAAAADSAIAGVRPDQWSAPTPCTEWDLRQLLNHMVGGTKAFLSMQTDGAPVDRAADHVGDDPLASFRSAVAELRAAFAEEGALEKTVTTPFGEAPGLVLVNMRVNEMMVHGWDVAKASGQSTDLDPQLAAECVEDFRRLRATGRGTGMFAEQQEAPAGSTAADQLAAVAGRTVS
jgi:uncharacterized protein (TIGR03086 family)